MRKTKAIIDATTLRLWLSKRVPKKSGMVRLFMCCVKSFVRLPRTSHAKRLPIMALPMPIHVLESPYFQPN